MYHDFFRIPTNEEFNGLSGVTADWRLFLFRKSSGEIPACLRIARRVPYQPVEKVFR